MNKNSNKKEKRNDAKRRGFTSRKEGENSPFQELVKVFPVISTRNKQGEYIMTRTKEDSEAIAALHAMLPKDQSVPDSSRIYECYLRSLTLDSSLASFKLARLLATKSYDCQSLLTAMLAPIVERAVAEWKYRITMGIFPKGCLSYVDALRWLKKAPDEYSDPKYFVNKFFFYVGGIY